MDCLEDNYKVTVFIPTYNRLGLLKTAVNSVLEQGDCVLLHILDNASTDGTQQWLLQNFQNSENVRITLRSKNIGALKNYQEGFELLETPYCVPLADDDVLEAGFIQYALQLVNSKPDIGAVFFQTKSVRINEHWIDFNHDKTLYLQPQEHLLLWSEKGHYISWSSVLWDVKKLRYTRCVEDITLYGLPSDVWFQFKIIASYACIVVSKPGSIFNQHQNQASQQIDHRNIVDFGKMNIDIRNFLSERKVCNEAVIKKIGVELNKRWCEMIREQVVKKTSCICNKEIIQAINSYNEVIAPDYGYNYFPFIELIKSKHYGADLTVNVLEVEIYNLKKKIRSIDKSLSWRLTYPLRKLDYFIQLIKKSVLL
jgi:glycosyltransferase involved in cell wall biosynthesis